MDKQNGKYIVFNTANYACCCRNINVFVNNNIQVLSNIILKLSSSLYYIIQYLIWKLLNVINKSSLFGLQRK